MRAGGLGLLAATALAAPAGAIGIETVPTVGSPVLSAPPHAAAFSAEDRTAYMLVVFTPSYHDPRYVNMRDSFVAIEALWRASGAMFVGFAPGETPQAIGGRIPAELNPDSLAEVRAGGEFQVLLLSRGWKVLHSSTSEVNRVELLAEIDVGAPGSDYPELEGTAAPRDGGRPSPEAPETFEPHESAGGPEFALLPVWGPDPGRRSGDAMSASLDEPRESGARDPVETDAEGLRATRRAPPDSVAGNETHAAPSERTHEPPGRTATAERSNVTEPAATERRPTPARPERIAAQSQAPAAGFDPAIPAGPIRDGLEATAEWDAGQDGSVPGAARSSSPDFHSSRSAAQRADGKPVDDAATPSGEATSGPDPEASTLAWEANDPADAASIADEPAIGSERSSGDVAASLELSDAMEPPADGAGTGTFDAQGSSPPSGDTLLDPGPVSPKVSTGSGSGQFGLVGPDAGADNEGREGDSDPWAKWLGRDDPEPEAPVAAASDPASDALDPEPFDGLGSATHAATTAPTDGTGVPSSPSLLPPGEAADGPSNANVAAPSSGTGSTESVPTTFDAGLDAPLPPETVTRIRERALEIRLAEARRHDLFEAGQLEPALPLPVLTRLRFEHGPDAGTVDRLAGEAMLLATHSCGALPTDDGIDARATAAVEPERKRGFFSRLFSG